MDKTIFTISKMDCPSEEQLIRMKLEGDHSIQKLQFDISNRTLTIFHKDSVEGIASKINELNLNSKIVSTEMVDKISEENETVIQQRILWIVLGINLSFFIIELITGFFSHSMGLVADSLDMFADALVYSLSLFAVNKAISVKKNVAKVGGVFQLGLACLGFIEVLKRFLGLSEVPEFETMILISIFALIGNAVSLQLLRKTKSDEAHMQASVIFTNTDVLANIGVIFAGILVFVTNSPIPDLLIGSIVFLLVANGAFKILKIANSQT